MNPKSSTAETTHHRDSPAWTPASGAARIDLWDETMREGAERSPLHVSVADKVSLAVEIQKTGITTFVTGMFPDVPHNQDLLLALIAAKEQGRLRPDTRFIIISHLGARMAKTIEFLRAAPERHRSTWVLGIMATSDQQIDYLFPTARAAGGENPDLDDWLALPVGDKRALSLDWLDSELRKLASVDFIGGAAVGLLDAYRADPGHLRDALEVVHGIGIRTVRLVDTAGTCTPTQVQQLVAPLVSGFPDIAFHGHFHNDFGMATANALEALRVGMRGVDVSVGGLANRAGHPALAEVLLGARDLYQLETAAYETAGLFDLSRYVEGVYGVIEPPAQPLTGTITYTVLSGIRTDLVDRAPTIFDIVDPASIGNRELRTFGVRSGEEGLLRILRQRGLSHPDQSDEELARILFAKLTAEWDERSSQAKQRLHGAIAEHRAALEDALFTEDAAAAWLEEAVGA